MANLDVLQLARVQFGAVHRTQLTDDLNLSRRQIAKLVGSRELVALLPSTYRLASHPDAFPCRVMATQLWARGTGFLSSWTAARIYGLRKMPSEPIHFTVPESFSRRTPSWIHLDRSTWYHPRRDRQELPTGLVVATPERMIFGLAADVNRFRFARAAEDAWHLNLVTPQRLASYLELHRCREKDGVHRLEQWLEGSSTRERPAQSHLEMTFIESFARSGLPEPIRQHPLRLRTGETIHLDIAWPDIKLAVEPGAAWFHGGNAGQARDHDRDLACNELGWTIIRLDETFAADPQAASARVARAYHRRRATLRQAAG